MEKKTSRIKRGAAYALLTLLSLQALLLVGASVYVCLRGYYCQQGTQEAWAEVTWVSTVRYDRPTARRSLLHGNARYRPPHASCMLVYAYEVEGKRYRGFHAIMRAKTWPEIKIGDKVKIEYALRKHAFSRTMGKIMYQTPSGLSKEDALAEFRMTRSATGP